MSKPMKARQPWMAFYVADYVSDTMHLTTTENGAYLLLIIHYWNHGSLPNDDGKLARIVRLPVDEWMAMRDTLAGFFKNGWRHSRIDRELVAAAERRDRRSKAGQLGGRASGISRRSNAAPMLDHERSNAEAVITTHSVSKDTAAVAAQPSAIAIPADPRTDLFNRGLAILIKLTGKTPQAARSLLGKWLKAERDDAKRVMRVLEDAELANPADPVGWVEGALRDRARLKSDDPSFLYARH